VLVVSGIWPPDVGGPASHAPAVAAFLHDRGHTVEVVTTAERQPAAQPYPVAWTSRRLPRGVRHAAVIALAARRARAADVVYATSMVRRAAAASALAGRPLVVKLVSDEAYERARRSAELDLDGRIRFLGGGTRDDVLRLFRAADAALLSSAWENFPHTVVEALAVGTPVIATAVGGIAEVVRDGENGLLVPPGDATALADAIRRLLGETGLRERLAAAAAASVEPLAEDRLLAQVEQELARAVGG
jgi:hypothetical protein